LATRFLPLRISNVFGRLIGRIYYIADKKRRRIINANLAVVFGRNLENKKRDILGRESCEYFAIHVLDLLRFNQTVTPENRHKYMEIKGASHLVKSIEDGRGAIIVMGHFGNFVLVRYLTNLVSTQKAAIIRKLDNPYLEDFIGSIFKAHNAIIIRPEGAIKKMHRLLLKNATVLTLADQKAGGNPRVGRHGVVVDFFGIPSQTHITAPALSRRTGASVIPVFVIRRGPGKYRIEINKPLELVYTEDEISDIKKNTQKLNEIFEGYIRKYPQHWFWVHRRWKDIPGLEELYDTDDPVTLVEDFRSGLGRQ
jgi:KDO2-lipid IV(A) lauroyltransferase